MNPIVDNDSFSGKDASATPVEVYSWTVSKNGKFQIKLRLTNASGGGDYKAYLTHQLGGIGTVFPCVPKTTYTAEAGETAFEFPSIEIMSKINSKTGIMVLGLAGDVSLDGAVDVFEDDSLVPITAGQNATLVSSAGRVDLVDAPNATAVTAIQNGLAMAAKLLEYVKALARKDASAASADIAGAYDNTTDSQEAIRDRGDTAWTTGGGGLTAQQTRDAMYLAPSPGVPQAASIDEKLNLIVPGNPINLNVDETDIVVNP